MLNMVGVCGAWRFLAGVFGGVPCCVGMRVVSCLALVIACCFSAGMCSGEPSRADVACWGGWGPHTPCARQIGPHPAIPARLAALRVGARAEMQGAFALRCIVGPLVPFSVCPRIPVQAHTGSHGQGVSRSDNLCSQRAEDGSPLVRAQSAVTPPHPGSCHARTIALAAKLWPGFSLPLARPRWPVPGSR